MRAFLLSFIDEKFAKFLLIGGLNTAFGFLVYVALAKLSGSYLVGIVGANIIGPIFNFFTTGRLVFLSKSAKSFLPFLCGYGVICIVNIGLVAALTAGGIGATWAQALCLPVLVVTSYTINNKIVFGDP